MPAHDMQSLDSYLTKLDAALARLPRTERQEIILETKSHISERLERDSSSSVGEVLTELGTPESYAAGFLSQRADAGTIENLSTVTARGWKALPLMLLIIMGYGIAALFLLVAIAKIVEPDATGWYVRTVGEHRSAGLAISDPNHGGRDLLGYWLIPISLIGAGLIHLFISRVLRRFVRKPQSIS